MNRNPPHQAQGPLLSGRARAMMLAVLLSGVVSQVLAQMGPAAGPDKAGRQIGEKYLASALRTQIAF